MSAHDQHNTTTAAGSAAADVPAQPAVVKTDPNVDKLVQTAQADAEAAGLGADATRVVEPFHKGGHQTVVNDPLIPKTAKEAPLFGMEAAPGVSTSEQIKGHAKYYHGKFTNNDEDVKTGAAKLRGEI